MRTILMGVCLFAALLIVVSLCPAASETYTGGFDVKLLGSSTDWNVIDQNSGGTGYKPLTGGSPWFQYDADRQNPLKDPRGNVENLPRWWNQWFYDGKYRPGYWKDVDISFTYGMVDPAAQYGFGVIVLNWSTPNWSDPNAPPMTNTDNAGNVLIERAFLPTLDIQDTLSHQYSVKGFRLPIPYNPEWVSIDVRGYNFWVTDGTIVHTCSVPEPGSLLVLGSGVMGLAGFALRRRIK